MNIDSEPTFVGTLMHSFSKHTMIWMIMVVVFIVLIVLGIAYFARKEGKEIGEHNAEEDDKKSS